MFKYSVQICFDFCKAFDSCSPVYYQKECVMDRKANLANCNYMSYMFTKGASIGVKREHANCVKLKAFESLVKTR